jgi:hypothetical protein
MALGCTTDQVLRDISIRRPDILKNAQANGSLTKINSTLGDDQDILWIGSTLPYSENLKFTASNLDHLQDLLKFHDYQRLWSAFTKQHGEDLLHHWLPETVKAIEASLDTSMPAVRLIPATRQISPRDVAIEDYSGAGLIDRLAAMQNPEHNPREDRMKFDRINGFLQSVTGRPTAEIEILYSCHHILVHVAERVLPLSSLGTGIQEVIMIAAFGTLAENEIICV